MSKYEPLFEYLMSVEADELPITFKEVESIVGGLPPSAWRYRPWWSNNGANTAALNGWLAAGWKTSDVDMQAQTLVFLRDIDSGLASDSTLSRLANSAGGEDNLSQMFEAVEDYIHGEIVETELGRRLRKLWPRNT